ncbi:hypothetical protein diail_9933 [Diaporthe ilicicola]|nr:hypothetical protein diail_9933 [Diaporthe ilicicola]
MEASKDHKGHVKPASLPSAVGKDKDDRATAEQPLNLAITPIQPSTAIVAGTDPRQLGAGSSKTPKPPRVQKVKQEVGEMVKEHLKVIMIQNNRLQLHDMSTKLDMLSKKLAMAESPDTPAASQDELRELFGIVLGLTYQLSQVSNDVAARGTDHDLDQVQANVERRVSAILDCVNKLAGNML